MKITSKGQVTIPLNIREKYMILPHTEIEFKEKNGKVYIEKVESENIKSNPFEKFRGAATSGLSTEEIMKLTRDNMNSTLVDSNILIDIFTDSPEWSDWSLSQLSVLLNRSKLCINSVIYTEVSMGFNEIESLNTILKTLPLSYEEIPRDALFLAGKVFLNYRRNEGKKTTTLPDFFIGAHASVMGWSVITRDPKRMKYYFPKLKIICP